MYLIGLHSLLTVVSSHHTVIIPPENVELDVKFEGRFIMKYGSTFYKVYPWVETQTTNQRQCNHGQWPEANVGQQY